jgi:hypothetical protein
MIGNSDNEEQGRVVNFSIPSFLFGILCSVISEYALWRVEWILASALTVVIYFLASLRWYPKNTPMKNSISIGIFVGTCGLIVAFIVFVKFGIVVLVKGLTELR